MCLVLLAATWSASAQTTFAAITGTVKDPTGAMIPNASVEAVHIESNCRYAVQSNDAGVYTLARLRGGRCTLRVRAAGSEEYVVQNIELVSRDQRRINIRLDLGALNTVPLDTRPLTSFLQLAPTDRLTAGDRATTRFAGSRNNQENRSIDGISFSNLYDGTQITPLVSYVESFQEVRIDMANNTAEFGRFGQVTIISKSGTNRPPRQPASTTTPPPWFRARNPFALTTRTGVQPPPRRHRRRADRVSRSSTTARTRRSSSLPAKPPRQPRPRC